MGCFDDKYYKVVCSSQLPITRKHFFMILEEKFLLHKCVVEDLNADSNKYLKLHSNLQQHAFVLLSVAKELQKKLAFTNVHCSIKYHSTICKYIHLYCR